MVYRNSWPIHHADILSNTVCHTFLFLPHLSTISCHSVIFKLLTLWCAVKPWATDAFVCWEKYYKDQNVFFRSVLLYTKAMRVYRYSTRHKPSLKLKKRMTTLHSYITGFNSISTLSLHYPLSFFLSFYVLWLTWLKLLCPVIAQSLYSFCTAKISVIWCAALEEAELVCIKQMVPSDATVPIHVVYTSKTIPQSLGTRPELDCDACLGFAVADWLLVPLLLPCCKWLCQLSIMVEGTCCEKPQSNRAELLGETWVQQITNKNNKQKQTHYLRSSYLWLFRTLTLDSS